ncbi:MAG: hypothetical protein GC159_20555 [Phycisphaera sp.]|nr:hypothetical protein [Phycisphaera sp.]
MRERFEFILFHLSRLWFYLTSPISLLPGLGDLADSARAASMWLVSFLPGEPRYLIQGSPLLIVLAAAACLIGVSATDHNLSRKYLNAGRAAIGEHNFTYASICYQRLVALDADNPEYRYGLAVSTVGLGDPERSEAILRTLAPEDRLGYAPAHVVLARLLIERAAPADRRALRRAEGHLLRALQSDPANAEAHLLIGRVYAQTDRSKLAEEHWRRVAHDDPVAALCLAELLAGRHEGQESREYARFAATRFSRLLTASQQDDETRKRYARALLMLGESTKAERTLRDGIALRGEGIFEPLLARQLYARATASPDDPARSKWLHDVIDLLTTTRPQFSVDDHLLMAYAHRGLNQPLEAIENLRAVLPAMPEMQTEIARLYRQAGDPEQAERVATAALNDFTRRIADEPDQLRWRLLAADAATSLKQHSHAVDLLTAAWPKQRSPLLTNAIARAYTLWWDDVAGGAEASDDVRRRNLHLLRSALEYRSNDPVAMNNLLRMCASARSITEDVTRMLDQMLVDGKASPSVHTVLGTAALVRDDIDEALRHLRLAYAQNPNVAVTANNLAVAEMRATPPNHKRALELVDHAIALVPTQLAFHETRGEVLVRMQRWSDAVAELEQALPGMPDNAALHAALATSYRRLGMDKLAAEHRQRAEQLKLQGQNLPRP